MSTGQENLIFLWYIKYRNNRVMIKWAPRSCYRWYVYVSPTHTCGTLQLSWATVGCRWFHIKLRWCHIIRGDLDEVTALFICFMAYESLRVKRNTHAQAIWATTLLWRNMEVVTSILITMTSQVVVAFVFVWGLLRCRQVAVGSLQPSVMTSDGSWPTLSYCWGPTMRLRRKQTLRCFTAAGEWQTF